MIIDIVNSQGSQEGRTGFSVSCPFLLGSMAVDFKKTKLCRNEDSEFGDGSDINPQSFKHPLVPLLSCGIWIGSNVKA